MFAHAYIYLLFSSEAMKVTVREDAIYEKQLKVDTKKIEGELAPDAQVYEKKSNEQELEPDAALYEKESNERLSSLRPSTERLTSLLHQFIAFAQSDQEPTEEEMEMYKSSQLLAQHLDKKTSMAEFKTIVENLGLQNQWTATLVSDFDHHEELDMISKVKQYQGVYQTSMEAPNPITSSSDKEDNTIYAVFPNPIKAYEFVTNLNP